MVRVVSDNINRGIAEALDRLGFEESITWDDDRLACEAGHVILSARWHVGLGDPCPKAGGTCGRSLRRVAHDFADPRYLLPAVRAYCAQGKSRAYEARFGCGLMSEGVPRSGTAWVKDGDGRSWPGLGTDEMDALRRALYGALTAG